MSLAAGLPCVPTFRVPSSQVYFVRGIRLNLNYVTGPSASCASRDKQQQVEL